MAESNELQSIVQALVSKTASGKLTWKLSRKSSVEFDRGLPLHDTSGSPSDLAKSMKFGDSYFVSLGSGFVVITKKLPDYEPDFILLFFFDALGNKAAEYKIEAGQLLWDDLNEMINEIHKKLFGFKSLVNELVG